MIKKISSLLFAFFLLIGMNPVSAQKSECFWDVTPCDSPPGSYFLICVNIGANTTAGCLCGSVDDNCAGGSE